MDLYIFAGGRSGHEEALYKKTASFLGSAGASLVDLDDLFSSNPKSKCGGNALIANAATGPIKATGKDRTPSLCAAIGFYWVFNQRMHASPVGR